MTRLRNVEIVFLLVASIVLWWHSLVSVLTLTLNNDGYTHILLILPLSGTLIYLERKATQRVSERGVVHGSVLLAVALLIAGFARLGGGGITPDVQLSLDVCALVTWWIGSVVFCFGVRAFQTILFPLCFLFWIIPIPTFVMEQIIHFLQQQSAFAARILFWVSGVPVTQDGTMLSIPNLDVEVARECSSIRSSLMLLVTTMVLAHLFLGSWWRKALLILAAIPLAVVKNGLRIVTITELGTRVDPGFFDGNLHRRGGILFLAIGLAMVVALLWALRRTEAVRVRVTPAH